MPTFFEIFQEYRKDPRSIDLSKKKYSELHKSIKFYYDNWLHKEPIQYKQFTNDAGEPCEVRDYPDSFIPKMKFLIIRFCETYKANLANEAAISKRKGDLQAPVIEKKKRTRKPIQQPIYSNKKSP